LKIGIIEDEAALRDHLSSGLRSAGDSVSGKFQRVALKKRVNLSKGQKLSVTLSGSP